MGIFGGDANHIVSKEKTSMKNKSLQPLLSAVLLLAVAIIPAFFAANSTVQLMTKITIMVLFAVSLNLQLGYADLPALGQVMYFGFGAYGLTLLTVRAGFGLLPSFFLVLLASLVMALFVGFICLRSGTLFGFVFLNNGIALLIYSFINKWMWIGADGGLLGTPRPSFAQTTVAFHVFAVLVVGFCIFLLYLVKESPFTSMLLGCRENDERLLFLGVNTRNVKLVAHVVSALFTVVAGMLFAMRNRGAYPTYLINLLSTEMMIACILGGKNYFLGPLLGAVIVTSITTGVSNYTIYYQLVLGIIIFAVVYFLPGGLMPGIISLRKRLASMGQKTQLEKGS